MNQPLIITERRLLPRLLDIILTLIAWAGFIWLIYNGLTSVLTHAPLIGLEPFFTTLNTMTVYTIVALFNGLLLIGWAKYNQYRFQVERRSRRPGLEEPELASSLHISGQMTQKLNTGRVLAVFHDDNGDIHHVKIVKAIQDNLLPPVNTMELAVHQQLRRYLADLQLETESRQDN